MKQEIECKTSAEAEAALQDGDIPLLMCSMRVELRVSGRVKCMAGVVTLIALGATQIRAESWGTSTLNAESWGTSTLNAVSRGTSTLRAESRETSTLHAESWGTSTLNAVSRETSTLHAVSRGTSTLNAVSRGTSTLNAVSRETSTLNAVSWGTSTLNAVSRETSTLHAESRETSTLNAESWGTSTLNAESWETSTLNAVSRETSTLNAESRAYSRICLRGSVNAKATEHVSVLLMGTKPQVEGGGFVQRVILDTPEKWCEYYGIEVADGHAILFKAVNADYRSNYNGFQYLPGTTQRALDWDPNPARECGGGLHFCPSPGHAQRFYPGAKNFIGLKVLVATLLVHPDGESPDKCRGPETLECFDVDINGKRIEPRKMAAE